MDSRKEHDWEDVLKERYTTPQNEILMPWVMEEQNPDTLPENEYQALMETEPHMEPQIDKAAMAASMETVLDLLETALPDDEREVIETTVIAGHSIRRAADILGRSKSDVLRLKQSGLRRLELFLTESRTNE